MGTMSPIKAMNLRFPDPEQRAAIEAAARQEGVSLQEYILSAAYARATAVEERFLDAFRGSMSRSGDAFAEQAGSATPGTDQRMAELEARRDLEQQKRGHAA
ncbi:type II toxin -antitoxin system TacA 1-like antitoxin [Streptomyces fagopyri]|uniref:type II toxin -antitoxin system TacA 1-like antitoxin n=1 Tax=Streptomyces fagopyri TaxID=2662397 RepID=UPI00382BA5DA